MSKKEELSARAHKAVATRRKNQAEFKASRIRAAKKAAQTVRKQRDARSAAALKAWETRRNA